MCELLARPHGRLICYEYPTGKLAETGGPPYFAPFWCYELHLNYPGNEKVIDYEKKVLDLSRETTSLGGPGLTMLGRVEFRRRDEDSAMGNDWVSIWGPSLGSGKKRGPSPHKPDVSEDNARKKTRIRIKKQSPADHSADCSVVGSDDSKNSADVDDARDEKAVERLSSPKEWLLKRTTTGTGYVWDDTYSADA